MNDHVAESHAASDQIRPRRDNALRVAIKSIGHDETIVIHT